MTRRVDWDRPDWGGHVTYAANGSWIGSSHGTEQVDDQ